MNHVITCECLPRVCFPLIALCSCLGLLVPHTLTLFYIKAFSIRRMMKTLRDQELCDVAHSFAVEVDTESS